MLSIEKWWKMNLLRLQNSEMTSEFDTMKLIRKTSVVKSIMITCFIDASQSCDW